MLAVTYLFGHETSSLRCEHSNSKAEILSTNATVLPKATQSVQAECVIVVLRKHPKHRFLTSPGSDVGTALLTMPPLRVIYFCAARANRLT